MVLTVLLPTTSPRPTVDASAARLQPWRAGHPRPHPSAPAPRSLTLCVDPRRPPRPRSPTIPDDPRRSPTERDTRGNGPSVDGVGPSRVGDVLSPDLCRARTSSCTPTTASGRRTSARLRAVLGASSSSGMPRPRPSRSLSTRFPTAVLSAVDIALSERPPPRIIAANRTRTQHVGGVVHSHPQGSCGYSHPQNAGAGGRPQRPTWRDKSRQDHGFPPETCGRASSYTPCGRHHHARSVHSSVDSCG